MVERRARGFFVYLLRCCDGTLYTGYTVDLGRRLKAHNEGRGAKYTRARRPVALAAWAPMESRHDAMRAEALVKRLSKAQKESLVALWSVDRDGFSKALAELASVGYVSI